jgi:2-iminobutanoate/2-iminopropanoate deaminase
LLRSQRCTDPGGPPLATDPQGVYTNRLVRLIIVILVAASTTCATVVEKTAIRPSGFQDGRPFEPGLLVGDKLQVSGLLGSDRRTGQFPEYVDSEVKACLDKIGLVLRVAGMDFSDTVSIQVFLTDMDLLPRMNAVYSAYFKEQRPARVASGATRLAGKARIEIAVVARR